MGGCQSLHHVVRHGTVEALRLTCSKTRDIDFVEPVEDSEVVFVRPTKRGYWSRPQTWSALQLAAWLGREWAVEVLSEYGASLSRADNNGATALHLAAQQGNVRAVSALLVAGSHVDATDRNGMTALHRASLEGHDDVVKLLCDRQADVNRPDSEGATALHVASYEGHLIVVYLLLNHGASVMVVDRKGNTPLHDAAMGGDSVIMHRLLRHGADIAFRNQNHLTAEELYEDRNPYRQDALEMEDHQSTSDAVAGMPGTPPRRNPSVAACSSIDACSVSGITTDGEGEEVTSTWAGGPVNETELALTAASHALAARAVGRLGDTDMDREPQSPGSSYPHFPGN